MNLRSPFVRLFSTAVDRPARPAAPSTGPGRRRSDPPAVESSWDDLLESVTTARQWRQRRHVLKQRYLALIRDDAKPPKPGLEIKEHESVAVDGVYTRSLISYAVEPGERAHAYLGLPVAIAGKAPGIVALHGTTTQGKEQTAGLKGSRAKAFLDHLCRRGYVALAPDHFVAGHRVPPQGPYDTRQFYEKHPDWTAVGKFTFENAIAIDVLQSLPEVDPKRIGALGHSLGAHGAFFLAAYDERVQATACNCAAPFFRHNPQVEDWARDRWYVYFKNLRSGLLEGLLPPIDMHEIIALISPRAFLDVSATNDGDSRVQRQRVLMLMKIMEVYALEKSPRNFAFHVHGEGHSVPRAARELMYAWMDAHLKPQNCSK